MIRDSANVGNEADPLIDHAARLRIVRAARQLDQLFRSIKPEVTLSFRVISSRAHVLGLQVLDGLERQIGELAHVANILIDDSPMMNRPELVNVPAEPGVEAGK